MCSKFILTVCLAVLAGGVLPSCKDDVPDRPEPVPTVELSDSLVLLEFHRTMLGEKWEVRWDLKNPDTWKNIVWTTDEETGLRKVAGIVITSQVCVEGSRLPESLGKLDKLSALSISDCELSGRIPESLYDCPLRMINIGWTRLQGELSPRIGNLKHTLEYLAIWNNRGISGEIPPELGECTLLSELRLHGNSFIGTVPYELKNLKRLSRAVELNGNCLTGIDWRYVTEDSDGFGGFSMLLQGNCFHGMIPQEVLESGQWEWWKPCFYPFYPGYGFDNYTEN